MLNSSKKYGRNVYNNAFTAAQDQITFLNDIIDYVKFIIVSNTDIISKVKFLACWQIIINGIQMWSKLQTGDLNFQSITWASTDFENLFGAVRLRGLCKLYSDPF